MTAATARASTTSCSTAEAPARADLGRRRPSTVDDDGGSTDGCSNGEMQYYSGRFAGQVGVVTGGASGIGLAIARRFVAEGGRVVIGDVAAGKLDEAAQVLGRADSDTGARVQTVVCDVTVEDDVAALTAAAIERFGRIDAMFNVAGGNRGALLVDMTEADWDHTVDLCLKGVFFGIKHAARRMIDTGVAGVIVNIASLNSRVPAFFAGAYCAAKKQGLRASARPERLSRRARHSGIDRVPGADQHPTGRTDALDLPVCRRRSATRSPWDAQRIRTRSQQRLCSWRAAMRAT